MFTHFIFAVILILISFVFKNKDAKLELDRATVLKLKYAQEHKLYVNAAAFLLILAGLALTVIALLCALRITNIRIPNSSETNSLTGDF